VFLNIYDFEYQLIVGHVRACKVRVMIVVDRCCMCKRNEESVNHLFLYYDVAGAL
jgi:hypothetical protein